MMLSTSLTYCCSMARSPVTGFTPPLASVAPITARSWQLTRTEHCWKYSSSDSSIRSLTMPKLSIRWAIARLRWPVVALGHEDRVVDVDVAAGVAAEHGQQPA